MGPGQERMDFGLGPDNTLNGMDDDFASKP
jgi:hypothetical protein